MSANTEQRKLAAIMFTDMVGFSALSQRNEALALELLAENQRLLRTQFPLFNGREVKTTGDGFLVEFPSALDATQCAVEIQRAIAARNGAQPRERHIQVRIGIHVGDVVHRETDMYGDGVNIAARIEPLAIGGGICLSDTVYAQVRNKLDVELTKLDSPELKHIEVPVDVYRVVLPWQEVSSAPAKRTAASQSRPGVRAVAMGLILALVLGAVSWWLFQQRSRIAKPVASPQTNAPSQFAASNATDQKSIAVLPFDNLSHDPENAYFAEGVQDEILTRLAKVADLKVIARTSTQRFKSAPENLPDIAKQLGALNILEGSVQKVNDQVRVNVQLINALTNAHLWAEIYDRKLTDIFAVESDIAKTIADTLQAKLSGSEKTAMSKKPTANPEAYELYLKGRFFWNKRTGTDLRKAVDYFNQAIAKDPVYARAYAGLADSYALLSVFGAAAPQDSIPQARAAAKKALELDDTLAEAHASVGRILIGYDFDFPRAIAEFERAIALDPNYATAHHWLGWGPLSASGQFDRAIVEGKRAVELDPLSSINNADLGLIYIHARRYDDAIAQLRKTIELDPHFYIAPYYLGLAFQLKGQLSEAIDAYQKAVELDDDPENLSYLGHAYARAARRDEAQKILARLTEEAKSRYVSAYSFAVVLLALGEKDRAMDELERAYREGSGNDIFTIKVDPVLDDLHGDPRFEALAEKIVPAREFHAPSK